jgi:hypothetical protein
MFQSANKLNFAKSKSWAIYLLSMISFKVNLTSWMQVNNKNILNTSKWFIFYKKFINLAWFEVISFI